MITVVKAEKTISFMGLSTDSKPIDKFDGFKVTNGSSFFEMDTQDVYYFDGETHSWLNQP